VVVRSEAWVCGRSFAGIAGSSTDGVMGVCFVWALCGVSECDREGSIMKMLWPTGSRRVMVKRERILSLENSCILFVGYGDKKIVLLITLKLIQI